MANITKNLSGSNTFDAFSHTLSGWVGIHLLDPDIEEDLIGFKVTHDPITEDDGDVTVTPLSNDVQANSNYTGTYTPTEIVFFDEFENQAAFEAAHPTLVNGMAYHNMIDDLGYVYYNGGYHTLSYTNIQYGALYSGTFGAGVFPNTTLKWKDITQSMIYKGRFANRASFESKHTLTSGLAYYDIDQKQGYVYYNGYTYTEYIPFADVSVKYDSDYDTKPPKKPFPKTSDKWKQVLLSGENREKQGWPPPENDPMARFVYDISVDPATFKSRNPQIEYYVKVSTTTLVEDPADPLEQIEEIEVEYRTDTYTYTKQIQNTVNNRISAELTTFFAGLPDMDYITGELPL